MEVKYSSNKAISTSLLKDFKDVGKGIKVWDKSQSGDSPPSFLHQAA